MTDRWDNFPVSCKGGLRLDLEKLLQGTNFPGTATVLQNYEVSINGGYERIKGFSKYSSTVVPGSGAILAVKPALGGVFAVRKTSTDNALYYSTGTGWGSILNTTARTGSPTKARIIKYNITAPAIIVTDGVNPAGKFDGTTYTHINGTGAPTAPKYAEPYKDRIALAPGSTSSSFVLTAPTSDTDCDAANGAIEINVSDTITGIKTFREDLYIFCTNSIHRLEGATTETFLVSDVSKNIGCLGHDTIQEIGGDVIFLSQSGLRSLAATERFDDLELGVVSKGIRPLLVTQLSLGETAYSSCVIPSKNQYRLFIYNSSISTSSTINFIGTLTDNPVDPHGNYEWSTLVGLKAFCAANLYDASTEVAVFSNGTDDYVYLMESGNSFNGSNISYIFRTPFMTLNNATLRKVMQKVDIYTQVSGDININCQLVFDNANTGVQQPSAIPITQLGGVSFYGTAIYGTSLYSAVIFPIFKKNLIGSCFTVAFNFSGSDTNPPHRIDSLDITFALKTRR
jgi:hypothetical protein